jgi:hypothetical protein
MSDLHRVSAHWAVSSTSDGGYDQGILYSSDPGANGVLSTLIEVVNPGTLDPTPTIGTPPPPWVTVVNFSPRGTTDPAVGVCVVDWGVSTDSGGRRSSRTRIFVVPAVVGPGPRPGYRALWEALRGHEVGADTIGPVPVDIPAGSPPGRKVFQQAGTTFWWAAGVAAALLDRPVVITGYPGRDAAQALGVIDAVTSLLPHGLHHRFKGGTWTENSSIVTNLAFGSPTLGHTPEQCWKIPWAAQDMAVPAGLSIEALRYFNHLSTLYEEYENDPLPIVQGLAAIGTPHGLSGSAPWALSMIEKLDLPLLTHRSITDEHGRVRRGKDGQLSSSITTEAVLENVLRIMDELEYANVPANRRGALAEYIAWYPGREPLAVIPADWWMAAIDSAGPVMQRQLRGEDRRRSTGPATLPWFLAAAGRSHERGVPRAAERTDLLWSLLFVFADDGPKSLDAVVKLWEAWPERYADPLPRAARQLAVRGPLARALLLQECAISPRGTMNLLALLDSAEQPGAWHSALEIAYRHQAQPGAAAGLAEFCAADADHPVLLLRLAAMNGRLETVAGAAADALLAVTWRLRQRGEQKTSLELYVQEPVPDSAGPRTMAVVDLIRWILELPFSGSCAAMLHDRAAATAYARALLELTGSDRESRDLRPRFAANLTMHAFHKVRQLPPWTEPVLTELLRSGGETGPSIAAAIADEALKNEQLARLLERFDREFVALLAQHGGSDQQRFLRTGLLADVAQAVRVGDDEKVAGACAQSLRGGCAQEEVFSGLGALPWCTDVDRIRALCSRVQVLIGECDPDPFTIRVQDFVLVGAWGPEARTIFSQRLISELTEQDDSVVGRAVDELAVYEEQEALANLDLENLYADWTAESKVIETQAAQIVGEAKRAHDVRAQASKAAEAERIAQVRRECEDERQGFLWEYQTAQAEAAEQEQGLLRQSESRYQAAATGPNRRLEAAQQSVADINTRVEQDRAGIQQEIDRIRLLLNEHRSAEPAPKPRQATMWRWPVLRGEPEPDPAQTDAPVEQEASRTLVLSPDPPNPKSPGRLHRLRFGRGSADAEGDRNHPGSKQ